MSTVESERERREVADAGADDGERRCSMRRYRAAFRRCNRVTADDHGRRGDKQRHTTEVEAVLQVLGSPTYIGDNGQGLVLKLAINISLAVQMLALSEGLLAG